MKTISKICVLIIGLTLSSLSFASYQQLINDGKKAFQQGQVEVAVQHWTEALSDLSPKREPKQYIDTSVRLAAAYQLYFDWTNLLLQQASEISEDNSEEKQTRLKKSIKVVEWFKVATVRDYFQNDCITRDLEENLPSNVAIFYPYCLMIVLNYC